MTRPDPAAGPARITLPPVVGQFIRFVVVGGLNTVVDLFVLNLLIWLLHDGERGWMFSLFKTVSFTVAVGNSYLLNKLWTFRSHTRTSAAELVPFLVVSLVGLIINVGVSSVFVDLVRPPSGDLRTWLPVLSGVLPEVLAYPQRLWPSVAGLVGTGAGLVWNFFGYRTVVFNRQPASEPAAEEEPLGSAVPGVNGAKR